MAAKKPRKDTLDGVKVGDMLLVDNAGLEKVTAVNEGWASTGYMGGEPYYRSYYIKTGMESVDEFIKASKARLIRSPNALKRAEKQLKDRARKIRKIALLKRILERDPDWWPLDDLDKALDALR